MSSRNIIILRFSINVSLADKHLLCKNLIFQLIENIVIQKNYLSTIRIGIRFSILSTSTRNVTLGNVLRQAVIQSIF